jgi:hypothetical protein
MFFIEYDIPLPRLAIFVIRASHARAVFVSLIPVLVGADWYVLVRFSRRADVEWARSWSAVMIAAPLLLIVVTLAALFLPYLTTDNGLSG